ncbi:MAG TPA: glycoside hydrolase family 97 N-terminal domain-containing protein [Verrucomicrobiales bacterium]|nr:glycoside hydrolase family 97 N-terminal domain-containing protein [Verrucomicrobiales bacterium]
MKASPITVILGLSLGLSLLSGDAAAQERTRRSQRVTMEQVQVASPDGQVKLTILPNAERLTFTVTMGDTTVIEPSVIIMKLDGYDLSSGVVFRNVERYEVNETYPWTGNFSSATHRCRGARITLEHDLSFVSYVLEARAFDDGIAYRHVIPGDAALTRVPDEHSTFLLPGGSAVWYAGLAAGHYEDTYRQKDIAEVRPGEWSSPPLTFRLPNGVGYAAITEANLVDYSGMGLEADGRSGWTVGLGHRQPLNYPFELRYGRDEAKRLGQAAAITGTITTPWRVVMAGRDLNALVNSAILPNLCPPPDPQLFPEGIKTAWVQPGRAVWRYVDGGPGGVDGMKEFSRLGGRLGFEHHVIEGFWRRWSPEERRDVVEYSKQQGVGLWFWNHSNQLRSPEAREEFFRMLQELGVVGAKIDFMDHEHKEVIDLYEALLRTAAEHRIMLNFHGANKPTGRERTLPNDMVREAVKGMESRTLSGRARHQTILPFTRYLAGAADYTTMIFSERRGDTTWANQIASLVIFNSPLLTIAANPQSILDNPAVEVIKSIPSAWDATIVLPESGIGELAAYARRTGDTWFVAAMCGPEARILEAPLSFLDAGPYQISIVRDGESDGTLSVEGAAKERGDSLRVELRAGGGFVARLTKM